MYFVNKTIPLLDWTIVLSNIYGKENIFLFTKTVKIKKHFYKMVGKSAWCGLAHECINKHNYGCDGILGQQYLEQL